MTKTLLDYCEPFFQEVCALLRSAGDGTVGFSAARNRLKECLERVKADVQAAPGAVQDDFFGVVRDARTRPGVERALWFFADDLIEASVLPFASQWQQEPLARELGGFVNGKTQFYLDLGEVLQEPAEAARQRVAVYYTCLCLGFAGLHRDTPKAIVELTERLYGLLADLIDRDAARLLCPEAYKADKTILYKPVRESVMAIGAVLAILVVATLTAYFFLYSIGTEDLRNALKGIRSGTPTNAAVEASPDA